MGSLLTIFDVSITLEVPHDVLREAALQQAPWQLKLHRFLGLTQVTTTWQPKRMDKLGSASSEPMRTGAAVLVMVTQGWHWMALAQRIADRHLCATSCAKGKSNALSPALHCAPSSSVLHTRKYRRAVDIRLDVIQ